MLNDLKMAPVRTVGMKQTLKAIQAGTALKVYLAIDVDDFIARKILEQCDQSDIPVVRVDSMKELGEACGIDVGAATAAILKS